MEKFDALILGGGASGIISAIKLAMRNKRVAIIEKGFVVGKKLLVTGNGRCNLTNMMMNSEFYNEDINLYLKKFDEKDTLMFFKDLGLLSVVDEEKRVYPFSNSAKSVLEVLTNKLNELKVKKFEDEEVLEISKEKCFGVKTNKAKYVAEKIVVATGGKTNLAIFENMGIKVKNFAPSLVALKTESTKRLNGVKVSNVLVTATCGKISKQEKGEVLFKESGLSGIVVFNLSSIFARRDNYVGEIALDLMPNFTEEEVLYLLKTRKNLAGNILEGIFARELYMELFDRLKLDNKPASKMTDKELAMLSKIIKHLKFKVCGYYDNSQVSSGGVLLDELTEKLESKKVKGLYFTGEVIDVDGVCGGYNLQWAWTSGAIVGDSLWLK